MRSLDFSIKALEEAIARDSDNKIIEKTSMDSSKVGVHRITYKDIDGKKAEKIVKGTTSDLDRESNELKKHDCKIIKTEAYINWR